MALSNGIRLNGYFYSNHELRVMNVNQASRLLTKNEINILLFCQEWLLGKEKFSLETSGSTGDPKLIVITRRQMIISAKLTAKVLNIKEDDRSFICLPAQYIAGKMMLVRGFVLNLKMTIVEPSRDPFIGIKEIECFDFTALVPIQLKTILRSSQSTNFLNKMKVILIGGSSIDHRLHKELACIKAPLFHSYGMTETVSHIALCPLNGEGKNNAFFPLDGVEIGLNNEGCLNIRAPVTNNQLIQTNDKVKILSNNSFIWLGRKDNIVVNSSGVKINVEKIESVFSTLLKTVNDNYANNVVFSTFLHTNKNAESHIYIAIENYKIPLAAEEEINQKLRKLLNRHEMPMRFFYLKCFPETATGKIDKKAIIAMLEKKGLL